MSSPELTGMIQSCLPKNSSTLTESLVDIHFMSWYMIWLATQYTKKWDTILFQALTVVNVTCMGDICTGERHGSVTASLTSKRELGRVEAIMSLPCWRASLGLAWEHGVVLSRAGKKPWLWWCLFVLYWVNTIDMCEDWFCRSTAYYNKISRKSEKRGNFEV